MKRSLGPICTFIFLLHIFGCSGPLTSDPAGLPIPEKEISSQKTNSQVSLAELEQLDGWGVLVKLRGQMLAIRTMRAQYTVHTEYGPGNILAPNTKVNFQVSYIRKGEKYHMHEIADTDTSLIISPTNIDKQKLMPGRISDDKMYEKRMIHNGWQLIQYRHQPDTIPEHYASIMPGKYYEMFGFVNDILNFAGLDSFKPDSFNRRSDVVYKNLGREKMNGFDCVKVVSIVPFRPDQKAYTYFWIASSNGGYQKIKTLSLIDDNPQLLIAERNYTYDFTRSHLVPCKMNWEYHNIPDQDNLRLDFRSQLTVSEMQFNFEIDDSEFNYILPQGTIVEYENFTAEERRALQDPNYSDQTAPEATPSVRQPAATDAPKEFTIAKDGTPILLPVMFEGQQHWFCLDTGASMTVFDISLKERLGAAKRMEKGITAGNPIVVEIFDAPPAFLGPFNLQQGGEAACMNLLMLSYIQGEKISGIIGMEFLKHHIVQIDFDEGVLGFDPPPENRSDWGQELSFEYNRLGMPFITGCYIDGRAEIFVIDTGADHSGDIESKIFNEIIKNITVKTSEVLYETAAGTVRGWEARISRFTLGPWEHKDLIFGEGNFSRLGLDVWSRYNVTFDFPGQKLYLKKNRQFDKTDEADMSGLHLLRIDNSTVVYSVDTDSPAQQAGIQSGDVVLKINDTEANTLGMPEIRCLLKADDKKKITLTIQRDTDIKEISFLLKRKI